MTAVAPSLVCTTPECGRPIRRRGMCGCCYSRWFRAGKPESGPPPSKYQHYDPAVIRYCATCGDVVRRGHGQQCPGCRQRLRLGKAPRTPAQVAHDQFVRAHRQQPRPCQDCERPIERGVRCVACQSWKYAHPGQAFPLGVPPAQRAHWVHVAGLGWVPPAGWCKPGETYSQVAGCGVCAYRSDCQAMTVAVAS